MNLFRLHFRIVHRGFFSSAMIMNKLNSTKNCVISSLHWLLEAAKTQLFPKWWKLRLLDQNLTIGVESHQLFLPWLFIFVPSNMLLFLLLCTIRAWPVTIYKAQNSILSRSKDTNYFIHSLEIEENAKYFRTVDGRLFLMVKRLESRRKTLLNNWVLKTQMLWTYFLILLNAAGMSPTLVLNQFREAQRIVYMDQFII